MSFDETKFNINLFDLSVSKRNDVKAYFLRLLLRQFYEIVATPILTSNDVKAYLVLTNFDTPVIQKVNQ